MVKKVIIFEENEIIITRNILGIKIKRKRYRYDTIVKFIVGKFNDEKNKTQEYHMYIDQGNNIIEIISCSSYKECMDIIQQIKQKTNKLIYDGTDNNCFSEEDLFRNYYKLKNTLDEIKGEN
jgi:hypothetical protein